MDIYVQNRLNDTHTPVIVTAQRLAEDDFCGYLIKREGTIDEGGEWDVVRFPAIVDEGTNTERALWEDRFPLEKLRRYRESDPFTFETQYMQNPKPLEGMMYREFKTYDIIPYAIESTRKAYVDTADTGDDYLCAICYVEQPEGNYVTDVLYTKNRWSIPSRRQPSCCPATRRKYATSKATMAADRSGAMLWRSAE